MRLAWRSRKPDDKAVISRSGATMVTTWSRAGGDDVNLLSPIRDADKEGEMLPPGRQAVR